MSLCVELTGFDLDFWTAHADEAVTEKVSIYMGRVGWWVHDIFRPYSPTTSPVLAWDIIRRARISIDQSRPEIVIAKCYKLRPDGSACDLRVAKSVDPIEAALRAFVASRFGTDVPDGV